MEAAFGRLHNNGGAAFGGPPIVVESIMVDGEVANIGKTYANMYRIFMYLYISHILIYFPYVIPGAISLAKSVCMHIYLRTLRANPPPCLPQCLHMLSMCTPCPKDFLCIRLL